jgi:hypothetical protein
MEEKRSWRAGLQTGINTRNIYQTLKTNIMKNFKQLLIGAGIIGAIYLINYICQ